MAERLTRYFFFIVPGRVAHVGVAWGWHEDGSRGARGPVSISQSHIPPTDCPYKTEVYFFTISERLTATAVLGETRIRAILTPVDKLIAKNPTTLVDPGVDPVAAMKKAAWLVREREQNATPVVRLVWIGGSARAMQLVNVYTHVSAILST
jgi:hypothetical protein